MGIWEFLTTAVVVGSFFAWLTSLRSVSGRKRVAALERRVAELERDRDGADLARRVDVIEEIVVGDDAAPQRRTDQVARASSPARGERLVRADVAVVEEAEA